MKKRTLLVLALIAMVSCVETPGSICREYCNANNEHIDALMLITSEPQAKTVTDRVFSRMADRYQALDKKWDMMEGNLGQRVESLELRDFLKSDELRHYRDECRTNGKRLSLELARLASLLDQLVELEKEKARREGRNPNGVNAAEHFPSLDAIVNKKNIVGVLRGQLEMPRVEAMLTRLNK